MINPLEKELAQRCNAWALEAENCPFCGRCDALEVNYFFPPYDAEGREQDAETATYARFYVTCPVCHASSSEHDSPAVAVEKWNKVSHARWD